MWSCHTDRWDVFPSVIRKFSRIREIIVVKYAVMRLQLHSELSCLWFWIQIYSKRVQRMETNESVEEWATISHFRSHGIRLRMILSNIPAVSPHAEVTARKLRSSSTWSSDRNAGERERLIFIPTIVKPNPFNLPACYTWKVSAPKLFVKANGAGYGLY
jgi:hypothetical protein